MNENSKLETFPRALKEAVDLSCYLGGWLWWKNGCCWTSHQQPSVAVLLSLRVHCRRQQRLVDEEETVTKTAPAFLGPLKGTNVIKEGQRAHFEARVEPQNDATMKVSSLQRNAFNFS